MPLDQVPVLKGFTQPDRGYGLHESSTIFPISEQPLAAVEKRDPSVSLDLVNVLAMCNSHKAIVNAANDDIVGVVSASYKPLPNREFFATIEEALSIAIPEELRKGVMVRDRMSGGGAWSQREYVFPEFSEVLKGTKFETKMGLRIVAWNSYDGSASAGLMTGLIDFFCTNGMIVGRSIERELRRHSTQLTPQHFLPGLRTNLGKIHEEIEKVRQMQATPLDQDKMLHFLEKHLSGQRAAEMVKRTAVEVEVRGENVFALHSALTYYASHSDDQFAVRNADAAREARMLRGREDEVYRLIDTKEWAALLEAA